MQLDPNGSYTTYDQNGNVTGYIVPTPPPPPPTMEERWQSLQQSLPSPHTVKAVVGGIAYAFWCGVALLIFYAILDKHFFHDWREKRGYPPPKGPRFSAMLAELRAVPEKPRNWQEVLAELRVLPDDQLAKRNDMEAIAERRRRNNEPMPELSKADILRICAGELNRKAEIDGGLSTK